jgi:hypothetical protein
MIIKLTSVRNDESLAVVVAGDVLTVNGQAFDFSQVGQGDTLPRQAIKSPWFDADVERVDGQLVVTLLLPIPANYSPEQAFPVPLLNVPDGAVQFPAPLPVEGEPAAPRAMPEFQQVVGAIDWSQLVTAQMKAATAAAAQLTQMKAVLASKNASANAQILRIQDRVDTLGYGIDAGEATEADETEQAALLVSLKAWKAYKFALGKVTSQAAWPTQPAWPGEPAVPDIEASPMARANDEI